MLAWALVTTTSVPLPAEPPKGACASVARSPLAELVPANVLVLVVVLVLVLLLCAVIVHCSDHHSFVIPDLAARVAGSRTDHAHEPYMRIGYRRRYHKA